MIKLNYTSLQHPVDPVEVDDTETGARSRSRPPVVISLHGHLAPVAWAAAQARPGLRVGFVQTAGGALPGVALARRRRAARARAALRPRHRRRRLRRRARGDQRCRAALDAAARRLGWEAVVVGPGPGILGSATRLGHGGWRRSTPPTRRSRSACRPLLCPRLSSSDERARHRGLSHHTASVLELLLGPGPRPGARGRARGLAAAQPSRRRRAARRRRRSTLIEICTGRPRPRGRADRPRRLRGQRAAGADDGPGDRRGPALLRRAARRRAGRSPRRSNG